ncbi:serine/threonine-protein kinase [Streptomyces sp. NPDC006879]|uniref:serine/threonine-protein kinase n=1 Tax=Streptomyces sp. NPDC006879 TaxID=3364767 RepID=UPI0036A2105E
MDNRTTTGAGTVIAGRYRLVESIGRGGMGKVWRAHDEVLHRTVAVKELTAGLYVAEADRAVLHARTQKEARAAARIQHPGVVTVHDVLEHDARPWIVMELIDGPSLADAAKEAEGGRVDPREAARVGLHVLGALRAAHRVGVLHRDVKPANILLARDGRVLITDFGIAAIEGDSSITRTGEIVGSLDYLAPERVRGGGPGPASDLWALGATLYTAVENRSPFRRSSPISTMEAVVNEELPPLQHAGPLALVITGLLRKDPAERPSAEETERMLIEAMEGRTPTAAHAYVPTQRFAGEPISGALPANVQGAAQGPGQASGSTAVEVGPPPSGGHVNRSRGRVRRALLVAVTAALLGGGGAYAALTLGEGRGGAGAPAVTDGRTPQGQGAGSQGDGARVAPEGYTRVTDPEGFSLFVPQGWRRQMDGDQIDYTPDDGLHRIRVSMDPVPDFENPYTHLLDVENSVRERLPQYQRRTLHANTFRGQTQAGIWEFTWVETKDHPGERRAIDQMYEAPDGTEYAIYMSGPAADWAQIREQFDVVLRGWQPAERP